jgi:hypothetical protein
MATTYATRPINVELEHSSAVELVDCLADLVIDYLEGTLTRDGLELALIDHRKAAARLV